MGTIIVLKNNLYLSSVESLLLEVKIKEKMSKFFNYE